MDFFSVLQAACRQLNFQCVIEADQSFAHVSDAAGRVKQILTGRFPINLATAARAAGDKSITKNLLRKAQLDVPAGCVADLRRNWQPLFDQFDSLGNRAFLKPSAGERGNHVFLCTTYGQLAFALAEISRLFSSVLLEEEVKGREYRILILDGEPLYLLERHQFTVTGDGRSTVLQLLDSKADNHLRLILCDSRMTVPAGAPPLGAVLSSGFVYSPLPIANGPRAISVWRDAATLPAAVQAAVSATRAVGLRYAGVDIVDVHSEGRHVVLEVNSAPELESAVKDGRSTSELAISSCSRLLEATFA